LNETAYPNEYRILIPSKKSLRQDDYPEMMAREITERAIIAINEGGFDFILITYANPDAIAHTGNFQATMKAVKTVDEEIGRLMKSVIDQNHILLITSDHGNAESVIDLKTGEPQTKHDPNPVPFYLVAREFQGTSKNSKDIYQQLPVGGLLSDVAPTILELMNIPQPSDMTGQSLIDQLT
jgi:2,3-bisphosphoglycerate-independent phosphoglycerate mutase